MNELFQSRPVLLIQASNITSVDDGEVGFTHGNLLLILCACLERNVHRLEALPRRLEQSGPKHRYQDAGEPLGLVEATASRLLLQAEGVLAVEQAAHEQPAAPAPLPLVRERDQGRLKGPGPTPWGTDPPLELAAFARRTVARGDERVPARVALHVGEHLPHPPP